ncbi:MAG: hypothetical protein FWH20_09970 [Oscillospiraceae bacterium]|nr:hypothetical protein [Oscillospiraceae bacterium]
MKNISQKIAYCGIICALSVIIMTGSFVYGFSYALPAISGIMIWTISFFITCKWALLSYAASSLLVLMMPADLEAKTVFIVFFGFYPVVRDRLRVIKPLVLRFLVKLAIFNAACVVSFQVLMVLIGLDKILEGMEFAGDMAVWLFWGAANIAFFCYEFCLSQLHYVILNWLKPRFFRRIK